MSKLTSMSKFCFLMNTWRKVMCEILKEWRCSWPFWKWAKMGIFVKMHKMYNFNVQTIPACQIMSWSEYMQESIVYNAVRMAIFNEHYENGLKMAIFVKIHKIFNLNVLECQSPSRCQIWCFYDQMEESYVQNAEKWADFWRPSWKWVSRQKFARPPISDLFSISKATSTPNLVLLSPTEVSWRKSAWRQADSRQKGFVQS